MKSLHRQRAGWWSVASLSIVALGVALRLVGIDSSLDYDELFSTELAAQPWGEVGARALADRTQGPLHIFLLSCWTRLFGVSEIAVRVPSVLFSLGFLLAVRRLAMERLDPWPGILLLTLAAGGGFFVFHGEQARPYAMALCLSAISLVFFTRLLDDKWSLASLFGWGLGTALMVTSSYLLISSALVQVAVLSHYCARQAPLMILALIVFLLPISTWLFVAFYNSQTLSADLALVSWIARPGPVDVALFFVELIGALPGISLWVSMLCVLLLAFPALQRCCRMGRRDIGTVMLVLWLLPVTLVTLASQWFPISLWATRQMTAPAVAAIFFIALGFNRRAAELVQVVVFAVSVWLAVAIGYALPSATKPPWSAILGSQSGSKGYDAIVLHPADGLVSAAARRYRPQTPIIKVRGAQASAAAPHSPLAVCRLRQCDALLSEMKARGYSRISEEEYAWRSFGLVGERRQTRDGERVGWSTQGGLPNAWLRTIRLRELARQQNPSNGHDP